MIFSGQPWVALFGYSTKFYRQVNAALRTGKDIEKYRPYIDTLNSALEKLPNYVGKVRRFDSLPPEILIQYAPKNVVTHLAYTSTTKLEKWPNGTQNLFIYSKRGKLISDFSVYGESEEEVLFLPNTKFKVTNRTNGDAKTPTQIMLEEKID